MPICQNCRESWTWKESVKNSFHLFGEMTCPHCQAKQYVSQRSNRLLLLLNMICISLIFLGNIFFGPSWLAIFAILALIPFYFMLFPFIVKLSNRQEF